MEILNSTEPHYIRCVKPNNLLSPGIFDNTSVMQQLRSGVSTVGPVFYFTLSSDACAFMLVGNFTGCPGSRPSKMFWIPYLQEFSSIFNSIWHPGTRSFKRAVSITYARVNWKMK